MEKKHVTRQWLNTDKSMASYIITEIDHRCASIELHDCTRSVHFDSYDHEDAKDRRKYRAKMLLIIKAIEDHLDELECRWP